MEFVSRNGQEKEADTTVGVLIGALSLLAVCALLWVVLPPQERAGAYLAMAGVAALAGLWRLVARTRLGRAVRAAGTLVGVAFLVGLALLITEFVVVVLLEFFFGVGLWGERAWGWIAGIDLVLAAVAGCLIASGRWSRLGRAGRASERTSAGWALGSSWDAHDHHDGGGGGD